MFKYKQLKEFKIRSLIHMTHIYLVFWNNMEINQQYILRNNEWRLPWKRGQISCPETSAFNYQPTPEVRVPQLHRPRQNPENCIFKI